ncbi:NTP transferase domain-containing protein [Parabacteroides sp. OttesenSCG-928-G07]|nr:NTP transferase domain-containing protein [Parabacteroides sp. OttesenSCG-928-G07]
MDYAIIAAGEGSRLVEEGVRWPKPLVQLNGVALVDRLIDIFVRHEADSISIIINEEMKEVQEYLKNIELPVPFFLLIKSTPSSMHSFYELSRHINSDQICLTTVDTIFREEEFGGYIQAFKNVKEIDGLMAVTDYIDDEKPLYVATDEDLSIRYFYDEAKADVPFISGGIYCLRRKAIDVLEHTIAQGISRMRNYQRALIDEGLRLKAYPFTKIIDVDHAEDISKAELFIKA